MRRSSALSFKQAARSHVHHPLAWFGGSCGIAAFIFMTTNASIAGEVGLAVPSTNLPAFINETPTFSIQGNTSCPTPSFSVGGVVSDAENYASFPDKAGGNSGFNNFGVIAGIRVPFGGGQGGFCKNFAELVLAEKKLSTEALLVLNCNAFSKAKIDVKAKGFKKTFPSYSKCENLTYLTTEAPEVRLAPEDKGPTRTRIVN